MAITGYHATSAAIIVTTEKLPSFVLYLESHVNKQSTLIACPLAFIRIGIDAKTQSDLVRGRVQLRRFEHKELFGQLRRHAGYHETESERALFVKKRPADKDTELGPEITVQCLHRCFMHHCGTRKLDQTREKRDENKAYTVTRRRKEGRNR